MKVRASKFVSRSDFFMAINYCILYGDVSSRKKTEILASNNWRKFHGIPMKRGWRKLEW